MLTCRNNLCTIENRINLLERKKKSLQFNVSLHIDLQAFFCVMKDKISMDKKMEKNLHGHLIQSSREMLKGICEWRKL